LGFSDEAFSLIWVTAHKGSETVGWKLYT